MATRLEELERKVEQLESQAAERSSPLSINGYVDLGFFAPNGNQGVGWVRDFGNRRFPEYGGYGWTFLGDILSTTINTRGEVADLGEDSADGRLYSHAPMRTAAPSPSHGL